ncbi:MAG: hypothetical protein ACJ798_11255 [Phenylobacterium sp.]
MGYRDDFYVADNVIGYTGDIKINPTVYFESLSEYGRITQDHPNRDNIGRNKVRSNEGHAMANEADQKGRVQCVERVGGKVTHTSRNKFIPIAGLSSGDKGLLYQAIVKFPDAKPK